MIIYNITTKVAHPIVADWQDWMRQDYMPGLLETGLFQSCRMHRLLDQEDEEGETFVVQCEAKNRQDYELFAQAHAETLRQRGYERFGNLFISFHTLMETLP